MEDDLEEKAPLEGSVTASVRSEHTNQDDSRVHHVLQLVEVPGGDEQKGLYARALNVTGGRTKTLQTFSDATSLVLHLQQLSKQGTPHTLSLASLGVAEPRTVEVKETKTTNGKAIIRVFPKKVLPLETPHSTEVLQSLLCLQHVVELDLSNVRASEEVQYEMKFGDVPCLTTLTLDHMNLRQLHPSVGRLATLQHLSLQHNRLTDLPLTIRLLRKLSYLNITGNPFSSLPGAVFHLHALETLVGYNECPLERKSGERWQRSAVCHTITCAPPLLKPTTRERVESLQEICVRSAVGMDCWHIPLPERHRQTLSELARDYDLCEECLQPVRKLTVQHETSGHTINVELVLFRGILNLPFNFVACSQTCRERTVQRFFDLRKKQQKQIPKRHHFPACSYSLRFVQDLYLAGPSGSHPPSEIPEYQSVQEKRHCILQ